MYLFVRLLLSLATIIVAFSVFTTGCENYSNMPVIEDPTAPSGAMITTPAGMVDETEAAWELTWQGGDSPFTVTWDFGGGAQPNTVTSTVTVNKHTANVSMVNPSVTNDASYTVTVTITDADAQHCGVTTSYLVGSAAIPIAAPQITNATFNVASQVLTVEVDADERALPVTVNIDLPSAAIADTTTQTLDEAPLVAEFALDLTNLKDGPFSIGSGTVTVAIQDAEGGSEQQDINVSIPAITLAADTLYALPYSNQAHVGDTVKVIVVTGATANPFLYMNSINVTFPTWVTFVNNSFNYGAIGGTEQEVDGVWDTDGIGAESFFSLMDQNTLLYGQETEDFNIEGRHRLSVTITPMGGQDVNNCSGVLFNFEVEFAQTGTASFGFIEETGSIDRTYYQDSSNNAYYWGTLMAGADGVLNVEGVDNTIMVSE